MPRHPPDFLGQLVAFSEIFFFLSRWFCGARPLLPAAAEGCGGAAGRSCPEPPKLPRGRPSTRPLGEGAGGHEAAGRELQRALSEGKGRPEGGVAASAAPREEAAPGDAAARRHRELRRGREQRGRGAAPRDG